MVRSAAGIVLAALLTVWAVPVSAQRGGETWKPLIPGLRTQFAAKSDPEVGTRLALVYAHEGMIYDGYRVLRQVDQTIGEPRAGARQMRTGRRSPAGCPRVLRRKSVRTPVT